VEKGELKEKVEKLLMNCVVGKVEDIRGTIKLLSYQRLRNNEVVDEWKVLRCEIRPDLRITDKNRCLDYAIDLLYEFDVSKADELMRKAKESNTESDLVLDSLLADVAEALKQHNIKLVF